MDDKYLLQLSICTETLDDLDIIADALGAEIEEVGSVLLSCAAENVLRWNKRLGDVALEVWE